MIVYTTRVYKTHDGKIPFEDWLKNLKDRKAAMAITRRFAKQITAGSMGDFKSVQGSKGILEFRNHMGPGYRVYCLIHEGSVIILLCGGDKSTQDRDIRKAEEYRDDLFKRGINNGPI